MSAIIPAILTTSHDDLRDKLSRLQGLVQVVQIDVVDGKFIKPATWPYTEGAENLSALTEEDVLPYLGKMQFEIDIMAQEPLTVAGAFISAGAGRIVIHAESTSYLGQTFSDLARLYGHDKDFAPGLLSIGIAINVQTDLAVIEPYLSKVDYVQFMGIAQIGKQGQPLDPRVIQKITSFRKKHNDITIQVDGGVSLQTAPDLLRAGVDHLVVGSALWKAPDLAETLQKFHELAQEYGIYE
jgi:ribulose-phosphate 3-epimerase